MLDAEELEARSDVINYQDMLPYKYPSDEQLEKSRVRGLYLNNFFFWNSKKQVEWAVEKYGYETMPQERSYHTHETIHCHNNVGVHDYIKYLKYGYSRVTDHACRDIRLKRLKREDAVTLVKKYEEIVPSQLGTFLDWVGMSEEEFYNCVNKFRDPKIWQKSKAGPNSGRWVKTDSVENHPGNPDVALEIIEGNEYGTSKLMEDEIDNYILSGRFYMDELNYKAIEK